MPVVKLQLNSKLSPADVLSVLTDFSPARSTVWPGVDDEHLKVHEQGPDWADITEGNKTTWEREKYSWDAAAGTVTANVEGARYVAVLFHELGRDETCSRNRFRGGIGEISFQAA